MKAQAVIDYIEYTGYNKDDVRLHILGPQTTSVEEQTHEVVHPNWSKEPLTVKVLYITYGNEHFSVVQGNYVVVANQKVTVMTKGEFDATYEIEAKDTGSLVSPFTSCSSCIYKQLYDQNNRWPYIPTPPYFYQPPIYCVANESEVKNESNCIK